MFTPEILSSLETSIAETKIPQPMLGDKWLVSSCLQKSLRRGCIEAALRAAASLWQQDRQNFWRRLHVAAMEDCSADATTVTTVLTATANSAWRKRCGDLQVGLYLTRLLCESVKSRAADELYLLLERSSTHKALREQFAQADDAFLIECMLDEDSLLTHRALAAWYLCGTQKFPSDVMSPRKGNPDVAKQVLRTLNAPSDLVEASISVMGRTGWPLSIFQPLLWQAVQKQGDQLQVVHEPIKPCPDVEGIPLFGCDQYTRIGQSCFRQLQRAVPALKRFSTKQVGLAVFYGEGGLLDRYITSPLLAELRQEAEKADAEYAGLCLFSYGDLRDCLAANAQTLADIRTEQLHRYLNGAAA